MARGENKLEALEKRIKDLERAARVSVLRNRILRQEPFDPVESLLPKSVTQDLVADGIIDTAQLVDDSVTAAKIAADAVGSSEIAADAVGSSEIAADAVGSLEIAALAVDTAELADDAITPAKVTPTGAYSFLKVLSGAEGDWRLDFGSDSMTGNGTPVQTKSIAHQLGVTPSAVIVTHAGGTLFNAGVTALTGTTAFTVGLRHINASNWSSTESFYYVLIGF